MYIMKEAWFPFKFNNVDLRLFILPLDANYTTNTRQQCDVRIQPTDALTIIETSRLIYYLETEGFLD